MPNPPESDPRMLVVTVSVRPRRGAFDNIASATLQTPVDASLARLTEEVHATCERLIAQSQRLDPDAT